MITLPRIDQSALAATIKKVAAESLEEQPITKWAVAQAYAFADSLGDADSDCWLASVGDVSAINTLVGDALDNGFNQLCHKLTGSEEHNIYPSISARHLQSDDKADDIHFVLKFERHPVGYCFDELTKLEDGVAAELIGKTIRLISTVGTSTPTPEDMLGWDLKGSFLNDLRTKIKKEDFGLRCQELIDKYADIVDEELMECYFWDEEEDDNDKVLQQIFYDVQSMFHYPTEFFDQFSFAPEIAESLISYIAQLKLDLSQIVDTDLYKYLDSCISVVERFITYFDAGTEFIRDDTVLKARYEIGDFEDHEVFESSFLMLFDEKENEDEEQSFWVEGANAFYMNMMDTGEDCSSFYNIEGPEGRQAARFAFGQYIITEHCFKALSDLNEALLDNPSKSLCQNVGEATEFLSAA